MKRKITLLAVLSAAAIGVTAVTVSSKGRIANPLRAQGCLHTHVEHHDAVEPSILKAGHMEYWCCCECHQSFSDGELQNVIQNTKGNPTDSNDGRYLPRLEATKFAVTPAREGVVSEFAAPADGLFDKVYKVTRPNGALSSIADNFDISNYSRLAFGIASEDVWFVDFTSTWDIAPQKWCEYELVKTNDGKWDVYLSNNGGDLVKRGTREGDELLWVMSFGSDNNKSFYLTNVIGILKDQPTDDLIDDSAISANGAVTTPSTVFNVPKGFTKVNAYDTKLTDGNGMHGMYYSSASLLRYDTVRFALNATGYFLFNHGWASDYAEGNTWYFFTLTQNSDKTWNLVAKKADGETVYSENNLNGFKGENPGAYNNYALNAILYGCPSGFYPWKADGVDLIVTVTEVRGTLKTVPVVGTIVDECALSSNAVGMSSSTMAIPGGFEKVSQKEFTSTMHGMYYSAKDLRGYSEVHFAFKTTGTFYFDSWDSSYGGHDWLFFSITHNADDTFNVEIKDINDSVLHTAENLTAYKSEDPGAYANYALNTLFYGNRGVGYTASGDVHTVYVTELRGTLAN